MKNMKKIILFLSLSLLSLISMAQLPTYLKDGTLVAYYPLDTIVNDTIYDFSGNMHDLSVTNTNTVVGKFGNCLDFSNIDSLYSNSINIPTNNNSTISLWINTYTNVGLLPMLLFKSDSMKVFMKKVTSTNQFSIYIDSTSFKASITLGFRSFIFKHEIDSDFIFIDGIKKARRLNIISKGISKVSIGSFPVVSGQSSFNGSIDDIAIWNTALSDSAIKNIFTSTNILTSSKYLEKDNLNFNIFPNPVSSELNISLDIKKSTNLFITNELGQVVKNVVLTQDNSKVDVSDLRKGIYFLFIENKSKKLIIN